MLLRLHGVLKRSRANGPGVRAVFWFQGCTLECPGCFNPDAQPFDGGTLVDTDDLVKGILEQHDIEGVSLSGGEPFQQPEALLDLVRQLRPAGISIIIFTGYTLDELNQLPLGPAILEHTDTLIAGRYVATRHSVRGLLASDNQHVHHVTSRYRHVDFAALPNREAVIHPDGSVTLTGTTPPTME